MFFGSKTFQSMSMSDAHAALQNDSSIILLDVRTQEEFNEGHIPGSINIPLDRIDAIRRVAPDKNAKLFIYCLSGGRSHSACALLARNGYKSVWDIGGITAWRGRIEKVVGA